MAITTAVLASSSTDIIGSSSSTLPDVCRRSTSVTDCTGPSDSNSESAFFQIGLIMARNSGVNHRPNEVAVASFAAVAILRHLVLLRKLIVLSVAIYFAVKTVCGRHGASSVRMKTGLRS